MTTGREWTTTHHAAKIADVTPDTIVNWCRRYGIGWKVGGAWRVSRNGLSDMLAGRQVDRRQEARTDGG